MVTLITIGIVKAAKMVKIVKMVPENRLDIFWPKIIVNKIKMAGYFFEVVGECM
jgi:hypothetical protein